MGKRKFQDRPPGTMAHQHRVGGDDRTTQPKRLPVKVIHPNGEVDWVPAAEYDKRRTKIRRARQVIAKFRTARHELARETSGLGEPVLDALAWSRIEGSCDQEDWNEARRLHDSDPHARIESDTEAALDAEDAAVDDVTARTAALEALEPLVVTDDMLPVVDGQARRAMLEAIGQRRVVAVLAPVMAAILLVPEGWPNRSYTVEIDGSGSILLTPDDD